MTDAMGYHTGHPTKRIKTEEERLSSYNSYQQPGNYVSHRGFPGGPRNDERENHVLLVTVINPAYPITCDVIHQICSPHGKVLRVVIFKKNGVQAMVEFDSIESAKRVKLNLHGCDIYSGCCTLRIEYAKPTRLNVYKNDNESYDFTNPSLGSFHPPGKPNDRPVLLGEPNMMNRGPGISPAYVSGGDHRAAADPNSYSTTTPGYPAAPARSEPFTDPYQLQTDPSYTDSGYSDSRGTSSIAGSNFPPGSQVGSVMMVYGLEHSKINAERLFNLFCLYGNVVRIKFLKSKEGCAMVQMGDPGSVEKCVQSLNNLTFFGKKMQLGYSKQAFLNDVQQPFELPDGSASFRDFMGNRNNRFTNPDAAAKNRISPPAKVLHFFNAPYGMTEDDIMTIFREQGAAMPQAVKMFQSKTERSSSGLIQFDTVAEAVEALILCNHVSIPNPTGKFPFVFKLCFSSTGPRF